MEAAEEGFTAAEAFPAAGILVSAADTRLAGIEAAVIGAAAFMEGAAAFMEDTATGGAAEDTAGVEEVGVTEEVGAEAGVGDLALGGRIGDMAGDIRTDTMATTDTAWGITRPTLILTRPTGLRTT